MDKPKYKICISGSAVTEFCTPSAIKNAELLGQEVAKRGMVLVTGATTGIPQWSAKGAKEAGGTVIGLSPAVSEKDHVDNFKLPLDYHDLIIYTGFNFSGRNLLLTRSADAVITVCGRMGTLNEFTIAFEDKKPQGILLGSGGIADELPSIIEKAHRGEGKVIMSDNVGELLDKVTALIEGDKGQE
ncbi:MAG: LOG family protein [bacterium]|nr:LOG family protein [bacterium]